MIAYVVSHRIRKKMYLQSVAEKQTVSEQLFTNYVNNLTKTNHDWAHYRREYVVEKINITKEEQ
jgi:hypothetical protein